MRMSATKRQELYKAIHDGIVDARLKLRLPAKDDITLAQVEHAIWAKQKLVLKLPNNS